MMLNDGVMFLDSIVLLDVVVLMIILEFFFMLNKCGEFVIIRFFILIVKGNINDLIVFKINGIDNLMNVNKGWNNLGFFFFIDKIVIIVEKMI